MEIKIIDKSEEGDVPCVEFFCDMCEIVIAIPILNSEKERLGKLIFDKIKDGGLSCPICKETLDCEPAFELFDLKRDKTLHKGD